MCALPLVCPAMSSKYTIYIRMGLLTFLVRGHVDLANVAIGGEYSSQVAMNNVARQVFDKHSACSGRSGSAPAPRTAPISASARAPRRRTRTHLFVASHGGQQQAESTPLPPDDLITHRMQIDSPSHLHHVSPVEYPPVLSV